MAERLSQLRDFAWLDSAAGGTFSVLAFEPDRKEVFKNPEDQAAFLRFLNRFPADRPVNASPFGFAGGWIGYMAYECYAFSDAIPLRPERLKPYPLAVFCHYDRFVYADHGTGETFFVTTDPNGSARFHDFLAVIETAPNPPAPPKSSPPEMAIRRERYRKDFEAVKDALVAGDYFELNYTAEFSARFEGDPFALYKNLRETSPAPYMALLRLDEISILSASPECFFSCAGSTLRSYPIKGTAKRDPSPTRDNAVKTRLSLSEKDSAELLMVTDMVRSDVGKVCETGSVHVPALAEIKTFSHCHHLVSTIEGRVRPGTTLAHVFVALFPGGSITGAPKIKVMEGVSRLERRARGVYTGALGFISDGGAAEFNIPIRTLTLQDGRAEFAAGGGLTVDSVFENEYAECLTKAKGILECLERTR